MSNDQLRIERKALVLLTRAERAAWKQLLSESNFSRWAFLSPTYAYAVNATLGPVELTLCWLRDELVGVMPLQRSDGWLGRLGMREPVGQSMTDYFGILARPSVMLNWSQLLQGAATPCLYFTHLDESQKKHGLTGDSPRIGLRTRIHPDGGDTHWAHLRLKDKKLVGDTERRERKLIAEKGSLHFEMQSSSPETDLESLVILKNAQYLRTGHESGALLNPANARLLKLLLKSEDPDCQPRLSVLRAGGELIAGHFGLQCGPNLHFWFPVYDSRFAAYSPGRILYRHILNAATEFGISMIDRGEGDTGAKREFANEEHQFYKGLVASGFIGNALSLGKRFNWRVMALANRSFRRV